MLFYSGHVIMITFNLGTTPTLITHVVASLDKALLSLLGNFEQAAN